jgi:hypothetical protein
MDMEQVSQVPASELFNRVRAWILGAFKANGVELNMGSRMLPVFLSAGLSRPTMIAGSRVESDPDSPTYDYMRAGLATAEEVAIDHERVVFLPRMVGAWSRLA